ncbi:hypothetical protein PT177_08640 [Erysipelothrix rhusiopathiae]|nr:hypothetical protein [Erysipelothrix rhusiopathiae]MDE8042793.1 hypothetical protein [Erysipelothrix rhusiopathiae]MDE8050593.1 hypothetical protein [Erysipelothrix rhusiopathiae]MDE8058943.1 hypothetical protein [Erysipelothrix rhusiopathiae]MDE8070240.1 hypothetical protein [Erysipelothrix rhusiopathiae]
MRKYNYKMKVLKMLFFLVSSVICIRIIIFFEMEKNSLGTTLGGLVAGLLIPYLIPSIIDLTDNSNWKTTQRKLKRVGLLQKDTIVRISFAYLFRIKIDGRYFLVLNSRTKKYQPVGGAYKFELEEANYLAENIPVENDDRIPVDKITERDYRLLVKNEYLRKFVKRFDKTSYRECIDDLSREFVEEIFSTNIFDKNKFGDLSYKYCGRHMTNVEYGNVFNHYELLLADIIEVRLSHNQENLFRDLMKKQSPKYYFASADEIKSHGVRYNKNNYIDKIANHTPKVICENADQLVMKKKNSNIITISFD